ncbi:MAG: STAS domain-containing protein [Paracoccaceae bacterium]
MSLTSTIQNETRIISVDADRIDAAMAIQFKDDMRSETADGPDRVVLDLTKVDFIDSSGLGAIVASMKQLGQNQKLELAGLTPNVQKVFRLTRMDTIFTLFATLNDAMDGQPV